MDIQNNEKPLKANELLEKNSIRAANNCPYNFNKAIVKINKTPPFSLCKSPKFMRIAQDFDILRKDGK